MSDETNQPAGPGQAAGRYAAALISVAGAVALRYLIAGVLGSTVPYITFFPAVMFSAWFGGLGPGILAVTLSLPSALVLVNHGFGSSADIAGAILFVGVSAFIISLTEALRRAIRRTAEYRREAEQARDRLHTILASIGEAVVAADAAGRVSFLNAAGETLTGWREAEALGKPVGEVVRVRSEGTPPDKVLVTRDGREVSIDDRTAPIRTEEQRPLGEVLVFRDITERKASEEAIRNSEARLKLALEAGRIGVWDWDIVQNRIEWSDLVYDIHGVQRDQFPGSVDDFARLIEPEDQERVGKAIRAALEQNIPYEVEFRVKHPNGKVHWIATAANVIRNATGAPVRMLGATTDVTARKEAEAQLHQQWHIFDTALSNTPDFTYVFDTEGRFTYVNRALLSLWQKPLDEAVGRTFFDLGYPQELAARLQSQIQQVIATRAPIRDQTPFTGPTGETRHYEYIFVPVFSTDGQVEAVTGSTRDITERSEAEELVRKSEERLTFALEAGDGIGTWDWDVPNDRLYCNPRFAMLFSLSPEKAESGASISELITRIHAEDREQVAEQIRRAIESGSDATQEYRVVQQDGSVRWVHVRGKCHLDENGKPARFPGVAFDITERKRAEEALHESQDRLRAIFDGTYEYIGLLAPDGVLLEANRASLTFANNTREEMLGRLFWDTPLFTATPGAPEMVREGIARAASGEFVRFEASVQRAAGDAATFDISFHPIRNERGEVVLIVPEARNITDRKRAEEGLRHTNEELRRLNRELEEFAYVAGHDLREPLRMVNIYTQLILEGMGERGRELDQYAGFVQQGVTRMESLIHDLLAFSSAVHREAQPLGVADLPAALNAAVSVLKNRIEEKGCVISSQPLPLVRGETSQMAQLFQNLVANALKYCRKDVPPRICIEAERDGNDWIVSIRDNGIGFEPEYAERIFGLFKRLHKEEYPGTGLGLAICKRIVERYDGRIWAEGRPGEGATFRFSLRAADAVSGESA